MKRTKAEMMEDDKGRVLCGFWGGVETGSGQEMLPDDWTTTANVISKTGRKSHVGGKADRAKAKQRV